MSSLLQNKSLPELMQRGIAMVSEIKSLDSDMQMLVYDNYNQFISATDTIRKMKTRVEEMETQMGQLETNMGTISAASDSVNSSLSDRRSQLEGLNNVKRNLTKLQFLMDLPAQLQASVSAGEYEKAVENHRRAQRILRAVGHVASFHGIREEAAQIMRKLSETLNARLQEPELSAEELGTTTRLLLLLDGNEDQLLKVAAAPAPAPPPPPCTLPLYLRAIPWASARSEGTMRTLTGAPEPVVPSDRAQTQRPRRKSARRLRPDPLPRSRDPAALSLPTASQRPRASCIACRRRAHPPPLHWPGPSAAARPLSPHPGRRPPRRCVGRTTWRVGAARCRST